MTDEHDELRETLDRLQTQLDRLREQHPAVAAHLESTIAEARAALAGPLPSKSTQTPSVGKRLEESVLKLEADHPTLAGLLNQLIDALSQAGI